MSNVHTTLSDVEFTLEWYREFLEGFLSEGYRFRSFDDERVRDGVFLRHDVDLSVGRALEMARLESELGIESTYLFLLASPLYNPFEAEQRGRIEEIADLGHDVGLHFSTHQYWSNDSPPRTDDLLERVADEQFVLETMFDADITPTMSFHIPPEWVLDRRFEGVRSTYEPAFFTDIGYVADSGQRWREESPQPAALPDAVQVLTHPGLWGDADATFERRIEEASDDAVVRARLHAHREFIDGVYS